jgi:3'(2'), 5'-bisphosphate nucleotidase
MRGQQLRAGLPICLSDGAWLTKQAPINEGSIVSHTAQAAPASLSHDAMARAFAEIAREAGAAIMQIYASGCASRMKEDRSPVTEADEVAEAIILKRLAELVPEVPVVAEECAAKGVLPDNVGQRFILVDPLDGTKEFINRNGEFTVNIALIENGKPVAGCVFAPAVDTLYAGGETAWRVRNGVESEIATRSYPAAGLTALCSRSHPDPKSEAFLANYTIADRREAGSSLKFCRVAEGAADVYPRFGPTMEWDVAAGHAVLSAAGGTVEMPGGKPFTYGKTESGFKNIAFVAWGQGEPK